MTTTRQNLPPLNRFLLSKEMSVSELQDLPDAETAAFFNEYAEWRKANHGDLGVL
jgi:hypothetical protein